MRCKLGSCSSFAVVVEFFPRCTDSEKKRVGERSNFSSFHREFVSVEYLSRGSTCEKESLAADSGFEGTRPDKPLDDAAAEMFLQKLYDETGSLESLHALR